VTTILDPNNRLFNLARQSRSSPSVLVAITVVLVILALVLIPGQILGRMVLLSRDGVPRFRSEIQSLAEPIVQNVTMFLPIYLGLWVWLRRSSKRAFRTLGLERHHAIRRALGGGLIAALMMAVTAGLSIASGTSLGPGLLNTMGATAIGIRFLSLLSYFVQGPAEEVLFRGWLLPAIGARHRPAIGIVVSSIVFSLVHAQSPGISWLGFVNLFLFGVFASVYALAEGGLWGVSAWHAVWNWAESDLFGFASLGRPGAGLLSSIQVDGPDMISGGAFGPEGGVACTTVFLVAIGIIVLATSHGANAASRHRLTWRRPHRQDQ
jgi:membrane protease YdiL (CAAX protease family)